MNRRENLAHLMLEAIDEDIVEALCGACEDNDEELCKADFMPNDAGCIRHKKYQALVQKALGVVEEMEAV